MVICAGLRLRFEHRLTSPVREKPGPNSRTFKAIHLVPAFLDYEDDKVTLEFSIPIKMFLAYKLEYETVALVECRTLSTIIFTIFAYKEF